MIAQPSYLHLREQRVEQKNEDIHDNDRRRFDGYVDRPLRLIA